MLKNSKLRYCKMAIGKLQCCKILTCRTARQLYLNYSLQNTSKFQYWKIPPGKLQYFNIAMRKFQCCNIVSCTLLFRQIDKQCLMYKKWRKYLILFAYWSVFIWQIEASLKRVFSNTPLLCWIDNSRCS